MPMSFIMSKNKEHSVFIRENTKGAHAEVYKFHIIICKF